MKENKLIKILIPVIAVIVVFESIMLVSNLDKNSEPGLTVESVLTEKEKEIEQPVIDFVWETDELEMKVGETYQVSLNLSSVDDLDLDTIESHVYFDPLMATITKLVSNNKVGEVLISKIDTNNGLISSIISTEVGSVYKVEGKDVVNVLSFSVTPIAEGKLDFDLSTSIEDKKFASIILEASTSKPLAYSTNKLEINVTK